QRPGLAPLHLEPAWAPPSAHLGALALYRHGRDPWDGAGMKPRTRDAPQNPSSRRGFRRALKPFPAWRLPQGFSWPGREGPRLRGLAGAKFGESLRDLVAPYLLATYRPR